MNIASLGAAAASAAQQANARASSVAAQTIVPPPEHGRINDTLEISASRSNRSNMQRGDSVSSLNMQAMLLRRMAERIIKEQYEQGNHLWMLFYGHKAVQLDPSIRPTFFHEAFLDDGYEPQPVLSRAVERFSPVHTAARIMAAAEAIAGGSEILRQSPGLVNSFSTAAGAAFVSLQNQIGGMLPQMSQNTYDITMASFAELQAGAEGV